MTDFKRSISFPRAAFEKRHDDPSRDYGIGCVMGNFALIGPDGAISWELFTGFYLPHVRERLRRETGHATIPGGRTLHCSLEGHGGAMYIHSPRPLWDDHDGPDDCQFVPGSKCYSDVGFLIGDALFDALCQGGEDGLFAEMERIYGETFLPELSSDPRGGQA